MNTNPHMDTLEATVRALLAPGKGLLAADESFPSIEKRFKSISLPSTEENRRAYRDMLFTTPELGQFISGVILFDETIRQKVAGVLVPEYLASKGMVPGIKVDLGAVNLPNLKGEKLTQGLDGLRERLAEYYKLGARFTKWRAVINIGEGMPSTACIETNAYALAVYAGLSQEAGLVPIVEPEVIMDGPHDLARCEDTIHLTLKSVFDALVVNCVMLEQMILKSGMVLSGTTCPQQATIGDIAWATIRVFRRTVPAAVPGIVFLSGGQSDELATERLNAIAQLGRAPWTITYSYGRALQAPALAAWQGKAANIAAGQKALHKRAKCNSLATLGKYTADMEKA